MSVTEIFERIKKAMIKDSGNRTEFASGAVRDIQEGKGRCDLLPLDAVTRLYAYSGDKDDYEVCDVFNYIWAFTVKGDVDYLIDALRAYLLTARSFKGSNFSDFPTMLLEVSIHFEEGAKKYGERNWEKGIPTQRYIDSAVRHYLKWLRGDDDERHDRAFCWNIICCIWTCIHHPELNEYGKELKKD